MDFPSMMALEPHGPDTFVGTGPQYPWGGLYGGQIVAQALRAATLTVEDRFRPHSLHAYFIRSGDASEPIRLEVDRIRNGRSFVTRRVVARQSGGAILNMSASFQVLEEENDEQIETMPNVEGPDTLTKEGWTDVFERAPLGKDISRGRVGAWLRSSDDFGEDIGLNACALVYMSDDLPSDAVMALHPGREPGDSYENFYNASLDHAVWFHRPAPSSKWQLHDFTCRGLISTRGLTVGNLFTEDGVQVATVAQEVLMRRRRS